MATETGIAEIRSAVDALGLGHAGQLRSETLLDRLLAVGVISRGAWPGSSWPC